MLKQPLNLVTSLPSPNGDDLMEMEKEREEKRVFVFQINLLKIEESKKSLNKKWKRSLTRETHFYKVLFKKVG